MLEIRNLSKKYGIATKPVVDGVSLSVRPGDVLGFIGLNGAGKTTTIRSAVGAILPDGGRILVDGFDVVHDKVNASRLLGWVPEAPVHDPDVRLDQLLRYYTALSGARNAPSPDSLLRGWGLTEYRTRRFRTLSLGLKKRFALAASEIQSPRYFLLDEVFNGLDPEGVSLVRGWIRQTSQSGVGILLSSHVLREVQSIAGRMTVIHRGKTAGTIDRGSLPRPKCRGLTVEVENPDERLVESLSRFGTTVVSDQTYSVSAEDIPVGEVASEISRQGYRLRRLEPREVELEEYFLSLVHGS